MAMTTAVRVRTVSEDELWRSYAEDPAVMAARRVVRRHCVCRGIVEADPIEPMPGVSLHNASPNHRAWRKSQGIEPWD